MKVYQSNEIRNIVLLGNAGSGKTTLSEAMMFAGGVVTRRGDVSAKNTVSDHREIEHHQNGSVFSTVLYTEWAGKKINIIDAPGADDFCGGGIAALHVVDTALMLLNAQNGVEVGAEIQFRHCRKFNKPLVFAVNHLDHDKTNFDKTIDEAKQYFGSKITLAQYPVNQGIGFNSIIDLLSMKMLKWGNEGGDAKIEEIPADEKERAEELQAKLIENIAENDESLMEKFFDGVALTPEEIYKGMKLGIKSRSIFPVFCIAAKKDMGVRELLNFIASALPSPLEMPAAIAQDGKEIPCKPDGPACLFVFKNNIEQHLGEILFFKVLSGTINEAADLTNQQKQSKERISQLFVSAGKSRIKIEKICAGDIGSTVKLRDTKTNHTLTEKGFDVIMPPLKFPPPKFRTAIKAKNDADEEKLSEILHRMREEDPTIILEYSKELKQLIIYGQGEFHINIVKWHLDNLYKIEIEFINPKIPYRETITKSAYASYRHKKQSGGSGQFGEVHIVIEPHDDNKPDPSKVKVLDKEINLSIKGKEEHPLAWGGKLVFYNCVVGGVIDARFLPAILKGIMDKMEEGPLTGSYARDIRVAVFDGKMHPVDSNEISFKLAGLNAFKQAFKAAGPKIMEPIYDIEVMVPSDRMGDVMSDLQGRRAMIMGMSSEGGYEKINARVPLAEMNKYSTSLSSITQGRATFTMTYADYAPVPGEIQDQLLKAYESTETEE